MRGTVTPVETTAGGWGDRYQAPRSDWRAERIGANPPPVLEALLGRQSVRLLAACGCPPSLVLEGADGTAQRKSLRRFLHTTVTPVAALCVEELGGKLDSPALKFDFQNLFAADIAGRARALGSLVKGGLDLERAAAVSGVLVNDD